MKIERRLYDNVAALSTVEQDYIPGDKETLYMSMLGGDTADDLNTNVEVIWDAEGTPEIIFLTHQAGISHALKELKGDGTKVLRIFLENNSLISHKMGGYWIAESDVVD